MSAGGRSHRQAAAGGDRTIGSAVKATAYTAPSPARHVKAGDGPRLIEGALEGSGLSIGIVVSRFNREVGERLLDGALQTLEARGVRAGDVTVVRVPGAFEIPFAARGLARACRVDAVVCLGAVVRGETPHFDYVAGEAARGIARASEATGVPILFGILTVNTMEQALERSGGALGNRGADAASAAIDMVHVGRALSARTGPST